MFVFDNDNVILITKGFLPRLHPFDVTTCTNSLFIPAMLVSRSLHQPRRTRIHEPYLLRQAFFKCDVYHQAFLGIILLAQWVFVHGFIHELNHHWAPEDESLSHLFSEWDFSEGEGARSLPRGLNEDFSGSIHAHGGPQTGRILRNVYEPGERDHDQVSLVNDVPWYQFESTGVLSDRKGGEVQDWRGHLNSDHPGDLPYQNRAGECVLILQKSLGSRFAWKKSNNSHVASGHIYHHPNLILRRSTFRYCTASTGDEASL